METLFIFLLKASVGIILFYAVYWFFLRKETFYTANRIFLTMALLSSILLSIFPLHYTVLVDPKNTTTMLHGLNESFKNFQPGTIIPETEVKLLSWKQAVLLIYLTGITIMLSRLLFQTFILVLLILKNKIKIVEGVRIVENNKYGLPFSFFNVVFINPKFHKQENLPEILAHEKVHIRENHWFDLLLIELLTVIFWFNPFIWFFERSIKQNHEYLADKGVLAQGHGVGRYQALLLNQLMGMQIIGVTNNLNFALNTNRLKMMTKKKTPKIKGLKFIWALPTIALMFIMCAKPSYKMKEESQIENSVSELIPTGKEQVIKGKIIEAGTRDPLPGVSIVVKGTTIGTVSDRDGTFSIKVLGNDKIVFSYVGKHTVVKDADYFTSGENRQIKMGEDVIFIETKNFNKDVNPELSTKQKAKPIDNTLRNSADKNIFFVVEEMPQYPGGHSALIEYVNKMKKKFAEEKNAEGAVKVSFTIDEYGKSTNIQLLSFVRVDLRQDKNITSKRKNFKYGNEEAQKAAVAIISNMKNWKPGTQRGKPVL